MGISCTSSIIMVTTLAGVVTVVACLPVQPVPLQHLLGEAARLALSRTVSKQMIFIFMLVDFVAKWLIAHQHISKLAHSFSYSFFNASISILP